MKKQLTLILAGLMLANTAAFSDIYMKQKRHTDGFQMMGQDTPAEDTIDEVWITESGMSSQSGDKGMLMLSKEKKMIMIDHTEKTYTEMPMNMGDMMNEMAEGESADDKAAFQNMMGNMMKMDVTVQATGDKQKIGKWNCKKYVVTLTTFMGPMTQTIWATEEIKTDKKLYRKFSMSMFSAMPGIQKSMKNIMEKMEQVKGVQVKTISSNTMMGTTIKATSELLEYKTGKAPKGLFKIPAGYTKKSPAMGGM